MEWLASQGYAIYLPVGHSPTSDLLAETHGALYRVQVKTSTQLRKGRWEVMVCTRGGNQSWNGIVKRLDPSLIDYLFVLVGDGRRWHIPGEALGGMTRIRLGGPKYAKFEVQAGRPLPSREA
jgi:hypothetical protein